MFPSCGGGKFTGRSSLAFFEKSVGAEYDAVCIPKPDESETADGLEFEQSLTKGVDLLFVLWESMIARVIEEPCEFGEFIRMEVRSIDEEFFRRAIGPVGEQVNPASETRLVEERFHGNI